MVEERSMTTGRIEKRRSLRRAERVLRELRRVWPETWDGTVECWANCREQGYYLTVCPPKEFASSYFTVPACVFAESRNSDQIVVVIGRHDNFDITTNMPTDACWDSGQTRFSDNAAAAKYIVEKFHELLLAKAKS
jgi:hypothetical protein